MKLNIIIAGFFMMVILAVAGTVVLAVGIPLSVQDGDPLFYLRVGMTLTALSSACGLTALIVWILS